MTLRMITISAPVRRLAVSASSVMALSGLLTAELSAQTGGTSIIPGGGSAVSRVATRGASFLELGVGARALSLGGAFAATANDLTATYWNVAGVADVQKTGALLSYERLYGNSGLSNSFAAAGTPMFGGAAAVSIMSFSSGDIERTTENAPDGGDPTAGNFVEWRATAVGLHYARPFTDRLSFGVTAKYAVEGIQFATQNFKGADFGVRFRTGLFGSTFGAVIANLGSSGRMDGPALRRRLAPRADAQFPTQRTVDAQLLATAAQLPTTIRLGVQTDIFGTPESLYRQIGGAHRLTMFADLTDAVNTRQQSAFAAEYGLFNRFFVRGGKRFINDDRRDSKSHGLSVGAGIHIPVGSRRFVVDYAYRNVGELQGNQAFSFQLGN